MMPQETFVRPPRVASWLVNLFTPFDQSQAIAGDLLEEFSDIASKSGIALARRWYRRQSVKTIANLFASGFSAAPRVIICAVLGGLLLAWFIPSWISSALLVITREHGVYVQKRIQFLGLWVQTGLLIIGMLEMLLIGCIVAIVAKGREILTTTTLLFAQIAFLCLGAVWMIERGTAVITSTTHSTSLLVLLLPLYFLERTFTVVFGGLIVRMYRNSIAQRTSGQRISAV
jgi:hypothetical protein